MSKVIAEHDLRDSVRCDWCNREYRGDDTTGGFLFQSKATCPDCAPKTEVNALRFHELHFITARCPPHLSFHAWVMQLRGGENQVRVIEYGHGEFFGDTP